MGDSVQEIKDRLNVVDVVSGYVKLTKAGRYHKGLCPFHKEKSPSFMVSPERGFYHCFGCGKGGDIFSFIEEMERVDFKGALTMLAERAGVVLERSGGGVDSGRDYKEKLYAALESARTLYAERLAKEPEVSAYLLGRGLKQETLEQWSVGFAIDEWRALYDALVADGYTEQLLLDAGLVKRPEAGEGEAGKQEGKKAKRPYDRFRGRIMFPLKDPSGRVVGFSGRHFAPRGDTSKGGVASSATAKYINSPESSVFDKSRLLYGMDVAKEGIRRYNFAILVEGQVDLLMAHQAGYGNTVALSGTAFTDGHAAVVKRYTDNLVIAFDGDAAGVAASGRAAELALAAGLNVKVAALPDGADPADTIQRDVDVWKKSIKGAEHIVDFTINHLKTKGYDERKFKLEVSRLVLPYLATITSAIDRAHFVGRVSQALKVPERAVEIEVEKLMKKIKTPSFAKASEGKHDSGVSSAPFLGREDTLERLLLGIMLSTATSHPHLAERITVSVARDVPPEDVRALVVEGDLYLERHSAVDPEVLVSELISELEHEVKKSEYREAVFALKEAERLGDHEKVDALLKTVSALAKMIQ